MVRWCNWRRTARGYCGEHRVLAGVARLQRSGEARVLRDARRERYDEAMWISGDPGAVEAAERVANGPEFGGRKTVTILRPPDWTRAEGGRRNGRLRVLKLEVARLARGRGE